MRAPPPADPLVSALTACRSPNACRGRCREPAGAAPAVPAARLRRAGGPGGSPNPLKQVLDAVGEAVECITYDRWLTYTPDDTFPVVCDGAAYAAMIGGQGGPAALAQWRALERELAPLQRGAALFPAAALRGDLGTAPGRAPQRLPGPCVCLPFSIWAVQLNQLAAGARGRSSAEPAEAPSSHGGRERGCNARRGAQRAPRGGAGVLRTMLRFGPALARVGLLAGKLTAPFSKVVDAVVTDPWLRRFMDLECFVLRRAPRCKHRRRCQLTVAMMSCQMAVDAQSSSSWCLRYP